ncbi:hypothetical protein QR46_2601 [Giardia duodenalis assemblage B]|uniref:Uncharacterized protein n=2 Tax=Giardia intestinalis TaxID=5741 RepID=A0A132NTK5_GIAIN|nr:Hypothetical protein GL50581_953 [Giardia intestinalis ATCC 50581]KWX13424.1 hypothetical protein QR46_2601 [Giardia intestinalis assemblage B]
MVDPEFFEKNLSTLLTVLLRISLILCCSARIAAVTNLDLDARISPPSTRICASCEG